MKKYRIIVAGGRDYHDYPFVSKCLGFLLSKLNPKDVEIVEGGARGADALGKKFAEDNGYEFKTFKAYWDKFGKKAGPLRNEQMANYGTHLVLFWDGKSRGSNDMKTQAESKKLIFKEYIVKYDK